MKELSYLIYLCKSNINWVSGETIYIPYINSRGVKRTYRPDFIINNKIMVEIKPKKLQSDSNVLLKQKAAEEYCLKHNLIYEITDIETITIEEIIALVDSKQVIFQGKGKVSYNKHVEIYNNKQSRLKEKEYP